VYSKLGYFIRDIKILCAETTINHVQDHRKVSLNQRSLQLNICRKKEMKLAEQWSIMFNN